MQPRDGCNLQAVLATKMESFISQDISLEFNIFIGPTAVHQVTDTYINSMHAGEFFMLMLLPVDLSKITFSKSYFRNTIRATNGLDPDRDQHSVKVGPDLSTNCFQKLSTDDNKVSF